MLDLPEWATPAPHEVQDVLTATAHNPDDYRRGVADTIFNAHHVGRDDAGPRMKAALDRRADRYQDGVADGWAFLLGFGRPRIEVPRRNPDGTVLTAEQLYQELLGAYPAGWKPTPEQRDEARWKADATAARWSRFV